MQATNDTAALQTVPEVADWLSLTVPRVYALVREGALPAVRIGRQIRIDPARVREYIADGGQPLPGGWRREPDAAT